MSLTETEIKLSVPIKNKNGAEIPVPLERNGGHIGDFIKVTSDRLPYIGHKNLIKVNTAPIPS